MRSQRVGPDWATELKWTVPIAGHCWLIPPQETLKHSQAGFLVGSLLLSPGSWCAHVFVCNLQESLLLSVMRKLYNQSPLSLKSDSLGIPNWKTDVGPGTFAKVQEPVWHHCFPVCEPPVHWVWGLILTWLHSLYSLTVTSPLPLEVGIFLGGFQRPPLDACAAGSCNFGVLEGEDEHTSFYLTELMFF